VESILFGHERGAFTGADQAQEGMIKQADGGTLFLDEVGELPSSVQSTFLRALQEHRFRTLGGTREIESDFRLVAATNRDLDGMVQRGTFRGELLFRLRALTIELPPLRERREDIKTLAMHYVAQSCEQSGMETKGFSPELLHALGAYAWPGNVRELVHTLQSSVAAAGSEPVLFPRHLPTPIRVQLARISVTPPEAPLEVGTGPSERFPTLREARAVGDQRYLEDLMRHTKGYLKEACRVSGLSRTQLYLLLKKHSISRLGWNPPSSPPDVP
jgi:two-component system NtrC family response regulator